MNAIARLLQPRSVAVIGASADPAKTAGRPVAYLQKHGFRGAIFPVNPRATSIAGLPCFPTIAAIPEAPDVGIILLGAEQAIEAVRELAARGTAAAIVLASGYTETGDAGDKRQKQLLEAAGDMRLLGPNTIGLVNLTDHIVLSASGALEMDSLPAGSVSVVSQSGGILGALLSRAAAAGVGMAKLISTSNEADLDLADFVDALADDAATRVIALYVETIRRPAVFHAAARKAAAAGKRIVAFKVGKSEAGAQAAVSHTGAMAGADDMYDALFAATGVVRAQRFGDLLDLCAALVAPRKLRGKRVAILTSTGGAGTLVADSLGVAGFETPAPDSATAARLRALQQGEHSVLDRNPIDVTLAGLQPELLSAALSILLQSDTYDAVIVVVGSSALAMPALMADAIEASLPASDKPLLAYVSPHAPAVAHLLNTRGVPAFVAPESFAVALAAMSPADTPAFSPGGTVAIPLPSFTRQPGSLDEAEAKQLFALFGVPMVRELVVQDATGAGMAAAELGPRVALKILSRHITHKSDVGGVALDLNSANIGTRLDIMRADVRRRAGHTPERFVVQKMIDGGIEIIVGSRRDALGAAILVGMGGVTAELFHDTALRFLPPGAALETHDAMAMLRELKSWPLLDGYRGRASADVKALAKAIAAFSRMVAQLGERLVEAEINPLLVLPAGDGVFAADGVVVLS